MTSYSSVYSIDSVETRVYLAEPLDVSELVNGLVRSYSEHG